MSDDAPYWDAPPDEPQQVEAPPVPQIDPSQFVPVTEYQQLQQQIAQMRQGIGQAFGYVQEPASPFDPEGARAVDAYLSQYAEKNGLMTAEAYRAERQNEIAQESGYINQQHLISDFQSNVFKAQQEGNQQRVSELNQVAQLWDNGSYKQAIKAYQQLSQRASAPVQNQTFGYTPSNQTSQGHQFQSREAFQQWVGSKATPQEANQAFQAMFKGKKLYPD